MALSYYARDLVQGDVIEKWGQNWTVREVEFRSIKYDNSWRIFITHDQKKIILVVSGDEEFLVVHPEPRR
jgi:hypothetical protein